MISLLQNVRKDEKYRLFNKWNRKFTEEGPSVASEHNTPVSVSGSREAYSRRLLEMGTVNAEEGQL